MFNAFGSLTLQSFADINLREWPIFKKFVEKVKKKTAKVFHL